MSLSKTFVNFILARSRNMIKYKESNSESSAPKANCSYGMVTVRVNLETASPPVFGKESNSFHVMEENHE